MIPRPGRAHPSRLRRAALLGLALLAGAPLPATAQARSGGNGTFYLAAYDKHVYVIDEATLDVRARWPSQIGIPARVALSDDRSLLIVTDVTNRNVELIERATGRSVDHFTLDQGNTQVRIGSIALAPDHGWMVLQIQSYTKLRDRFQIGEPVLVRYDLSTHAVTDTIPWPDGPDAASGSTLFSPDGRLLWVLGDDLVALDAETFAEVDRWALSRPIEPGLGEMFFGFSQSLYEDAGIYTGLFRTSDPVQHRRLMGIARVDLAAKDVDFYTLGPSQPVSFTLAPDGRTAYGLYSDIGRYEFWTFDLQNRRVAQRQEFPGRPRMRLAASTNGELLYIATAGATIDVYDAATYQPLRTVTLDTDMIGWVLVPPED
ncbi:MAG: hypothetical protein R3E98_16925 [Gemmatimonadota bacterium]